MTKLLSKLVRALWPEAHWHWSNDNQGPHWVSKGPPWNGRAWLHSGTGWVLGYEWGLSTRLGAAGVSLDVAPYDEHSLCLGVRTGFINQYVFLEMPWGLRKVLSRTFGIPEYEGRKLSLSTHDGAIWWKVWVDGDSWSCTTPRWRDGNFKVVDLLLGKHEHTEDVEQDWQEVTIPVDDGYRARVKISRVTWKRPRLPWPDVHWVADVEMLQPIPFSGKGENDYDCDDDALFELSTPATSVGAAVLAVVNSVYKTRIQRGDPFRWTGKVPDPVEPVREGG